MVWLLPGHVFGCPYDDDGELLQEAEWQHHYCDVVAGFPVVFV